MAKIEQLNTQLKKMSQLTNTLAYSLAEDVTKNESLITLT
jgi:hypothetical protein